MSVMKKKRTHWFTSVKLSIFSSNLNDLMLSVFDSCIYCLQFIVFFSSDLNDLILEPLRQLYFSSSVYFKVKTCLLVVFMVNKEFSSLFSFCVSFISAYFDFDYCIYTTHTGKFKQSVAVMITKLCMNRTTKHRTYSLTCRTLTLILVKHRGEHFLWFNWWNWNKQSFAVIIFTQDRPDVHHQITP